MSFIFENQPLASSTDDDATTTTSHRPHSNSASELMKANEELKKGNASLATTFIEMDEQVEALRAENRQLTRFNEKLSREVSRARARQRNSISSDVQLDLMKSELEQELTAAHQRERALRKRLQAADNALARFEVERDEARAEVAKLAAQIETLKMESRVNLELIDVIDQLNFANEDFKAKITNLEDENIDLRQALERVHEEQQKRDATLRAKISQTNQLARYHEAAMTSYSTLNLSQLPTTYADMPAPMVLLSRSRRGDSFLVSKGSIISHQQPEANLADVMMIDMRARLAEWRARYERSEAEKRNLQDRVSRLETTFVKEPPLEVSALGRSLMFDMIDSDDVANNNYNDIHNHHLNHHQQQHEQQPSLTYSAMSTSSSVGIQTCFNANDWHLNVKSTTKRSLIARLCCCIRCAD